MTRTITQSFRNADGSVDTTRAMRAGRQARADAFRDFLMIAKQMIKARLPISTREPLRHVSDLKLKVYL